MAFACGLTVTKTVLVFWLRSTMTRSSNIKKEEQTQHDLHTSKPSVEGPADHPRMLKNLSVWLQPVLQGDVTKSFWEH